MLSLLGILLFLDYLLFPVVVTPVVGVDFSIGFNGDFVEISVVGGLVAVVVGFVTVAIEDFNVLGCELIVVGLGEFVVAVVVVVVAVVGDGDFRLLSDGGIFISFS